MNDLVSISAITPLRQRLIDDMEVRRFSRETQRNYIRDIGRFATFLRRSPDTATAEDMASRGWSHISVAEPGRLAFLSGQIAASRGNEHVPDDLAGQAKLATASLAAALKELEASAQDIVMIRVYVVNATSEAFGQAVTPLRELLGDAMPSITTIGVQALYKPEIKVEIEMVVRLP